MRRLKIWLWERFLPAWAKDSVYRENQALREKLAQMNTTSLRTYTAAGMVMWSFCSICNTQ